jgi:hypothetical protein
MGYRLNGWKVRGKTWRTKASPGDAANRGLLY